MKRNEIIIFISVVAVLIAAFLISWCTSNNREIKNESIESVSISESLDSVVTDEEKPSKDSESAEERLKRLDPKWYRTKEGEEERLAAKSGDYVYPKKIMVSYKGLMYGFGVGMSTLDVMMKMGDPDEYSQSNNVLVWYYDHSRLQFYFINGELDNIVQISNK